MAADGGVDFAVRLQNQVTGPAKAIKSSMADVRRAFEQTRKVIEAPAPRRSATSDWQKMMAKSRGSQAADFARQQARAFKAQATAAKTATKEKLKEQKRVADFHKGMAQTKLDKQAGMVDAASSALGYGVAAVGAAALAAAAGVAYLGVQFTKASIEGAQFAQNSKLALTLLTGSADVGAQQFNSLRKEAAGLGLDVERTQLSFQKLLAAQFSIGKSRELIRMGADLQAIGAKADDVEGVLLAITQIKSKGKLQAEEMLQLQERGISSELVYGALSKRMGKSKDQLMAMQKKGKLGGPEVIESILEAVRYKTGVQKTGDAGKKFATTTMTGMANSMRGDAKNFFIDVGEAMTPGLTRLLSVVQRGISTIADSPKFAQLGQFMLAKFETFVSWVEINWPYISLLLTTGLDGFRASLEIAFDMVDVSTMKGKIFAGVMGILALTLGLVAVAGFLLMLPLYALIAIIGLVAYAIYKAVDWLVGAWQKLTRFGGDGPSATTAWNQAIPGLTSISEGPKITTAADTGVSARIPSVMSGVGGESVTVAGEQQAPAVNKVVNMNGWQVGTGIDEAALLSKVKTTVRKELEES